MDGGELGLRRAVFRGVAGVDEDAGGVVREILARDDLRAEVAVFDLDQLVRLRVVVIDGVRQRGIYFDVLHVQRGRDRAAAVGTVHAVGGIEDFGERGGVELGRLVVADGLAFRKSLHQGHAACFGGRGEDDFGGFCVDFRGCGVLRGADESGEDGERGGGENGEMFHGWAPFLPEF